MDIVRWGMIGHGSVTEVKSGPPLYKCEHSVLRGVYGRNKEKALDYAKRHRIGLVYDTVEQMLADPEIDAVYLPLPPNLHRDYALRCIDAGKIPYIEKPMAMNYGECVEIMERATAKHLPVYVAFYRRGLEKFLKIKSIIDAGDIGSVRSVEIRHYLPPEAADRDRNKLPWRLIPEISGGGKFLDMAVHVLDILDFLVGPITEARGFATNQGGLYDVEDTVTAGFQFTSGVLGSGSWCYVADHAEEGVRILGDRGSLSFEALGYGPLTLRQGDQTRVFHFNAPEHIGQPYIQSIVNELTGRGKSNANLASASNVIKITDQILADYRKRYTDK